MRQRCILKPIRPWPTLVFSKKILVNISILLAFCAPAQAQFSPEKPNPLETTLIESSVQLLELPDNSSALKDGVLCLWHQKPCLISENKIYEIDTKELKCSACELPGINKPSYLQVSQDGRLLGITTEGNDDYVFIESTSVHGFEKIKTPVRVSGAASPNILLSARGNNILFLLKRNLFCYDGTKWDTKILPHVEGTFYFPTEMLLSREKLYLRYDFGHYGGGLLCFDLSTGECKKIFDKSAVTDMLLDSKDKLWFTHQDSEGGIVHGVLASYENDKITDVLSDKKDSNPFMSLALNQADSFLIGTLDKGLYKFTQGQPVEKITPDWNANAFILSILPLDADGFCFFASGHGVIVSNNLVDPKFKSTNSASLFRLSMKKYFFQTAGNRQYFNDSAVALEKTGKFAQASAFYLLSAIDFANENDDKGAELAIACSERSAINASSELIHPLTKELFSIANSELIKSIKLKKFALRTIQNIYHEQKLPSDANLEAANGLLKLFPEDTQLVRKRNSQSQSQPQFSTETDSPADDSSFGHEQSFGPGGGTTKQAEVEMQMQMQMQSQPQ